MARGDVVSDSNIVVGAGNVDIRPAAGVEWLITQVGTNTPASSAHKWRAKDSAANVIDFNVDLNAGNTSVSGSAQAPVLGNQQRKIFVSNAEFLNAIGDVAGQTVCFFGVQTK